MQSIKQPVTAPMPSTSYCFAPRPCRAKILRVRAAADASGLNPFKKRDDKKEVGTGWSNTPHPGGTHTHTHMYTLHKQQDAAKKALQEMFEGKKDILAAYDAQPDTGGPGGAGGKGRFGGGGGGFGGFSEGFSDFGDNARKFFKSLGSTVGALFMFVGVVAVFSLWQPLMGLIVYVVRTALRLDARGAQRVRQRKMQQVW